MDLHPDFRDFLAVLASEAVEYVVVGGYAVSFHTRPRFTKDIDILVGATVENRNRLRACMQAFGAPDAVQQAVLTATPDDILWFGAPPNRVDILFGIPGVTFDEVYPRRVTTTWDGVPVSLLGAEDLIAAKKAAGREQDLLDVKALERLLRRD